MNSIFMLTQKPFIRWMECLHELIDSRKPYQNTDLSVIDRNNVVGVTLCGGPNIGCLIAALVEAHVLLNLAIPLPFQTRERLRINERGDFSRAIRFPTLSWGNLPWVLALSDSIYFRFFKPASTLTIKMIPQQKDRKCVRKKGMDQHLIESELLSSQALIQHKELERNKILDQHLMENSILSHDSFSWKVRSQTSVSSKKILTCSMTKYHENLYQCDNKLTFPQHSMDWMKEWMKKMMSSPLILLEWICIACELNERMSEMCDAYEKQKEAHQFQIEKQKKQIQTLSTTMKQLANELTISTEAFQLLHQKFRSLSRLFYDSSSHDTPQSTNPSPHLLAPLSSRSSADSLVSSLCDARTGPSCGSVSLLSKPNCSALPTMNTGAIDTEKTRKLEICIHSPRTPSRNLNFVYDDLMVHTFEGIAASAISAVPSKSMLHPGPFFLWRMKEEKESRKIGKNRILSEEGEPLKADTCDKAEECFPINASPEDNACILPLTYEFRNTTSKDSLSSQDISRPIHGNDCLSGEHLTVSPKPLFLSDVTSKSFEDFITKLELQTLASCSENLDGKFRKVVSDHETLVGSSLGCQEVITRAPRLSCGMSSDSRQQENPLRYSIDDLNQLENLNEVVTSNSRYFSPMLNGEYETPTKPFSSANVTSQTSQEEDPLLTLETTNLSSRSFSRLSRCSSLFGHDERRQLNPTPYSSLYHYSCGSRRDEYDFEVFTPFTEALEEKDNEFIRINWFPTDSLNAYHKEKVEDYCVVLDRYPYSFPPEKSILWDQYWMHQMKDLDTFFNRRSHVAKIQIQPKELRLPLGTYDKDRVVIIAPCFGTLYWGCMLKKRLDQDLVKKILVCLPPLDPRLTLDAKAWLQIATERMLRIPNQRHSPQDVDLTITLDSAIDYALISSEQLCQTYMKQLGYGTFFDFMNELSCISQYTDTHLLRWLKVATNNRDKNYLSFIDSKSNHLRTCFITKEVMISSIEYLCYSMSQFCKTTIILCCGIGYLDREKVARWIPNPNNIKNRFSMLSSSCFCEPRSFSHFPREQAKSWVDSIFLLPSDFLTIQNKHGDNVLILKLVSLSRFLRLSETMKKNTEMNILLDAGGAGTEIFSLTHCPTTSTFNPRPAYNMITSMTKLDQKAYETSYTSKNGGTINVKLCRSPNLLFSNHSVKDPFFPCGSHERGYREMDLTHFIFNIAQLCPLLKIDLQLD